MIRSRGDTSPSSSVSRVVLPAPGGPTDEDREAALHHRRQPRHERRSGTAERRRARRARTGATRSAGSRSAGGWRCRARRARRAPSRPASRRRPGTSASATACRAAPRRCRPSVARVASGRRSARPPSPTAAPTSILRPSTNVTHVDSCELTSISSTSGVGHVRLERAGAGQLGDAHAPAPHGRLVGSSGRSPPASRSWLIVAISSLSHAPTSSCWRRASAASERRRPRGRHGPHRRRVPTRRARSPRRAGWRRVRSAVPRARRCRRPTSVRRGSPADAPSIGRDELGETIRHVRGEHRRAAQQGQPEEPPL